MSWLIIPASSINLWQKMAGNPGILLRDAQGNLSSFISRHTKNSLCVQFDCRELGCVLEKACALSTMKQLVFIVLHTFIALCFAPQSSLGQILSSPAINIAQGKKIEATSTCGVDVSEPELFCKLATVPGKFAIEGLSCDHCDPSAPSKNHPIEYAIDGTERWWQSPPLSRGLQYQQVNITIDLGQVRFHVFRFTGHMAASICSLLILMLVVLH